MKRKYNSYYILKLDIKKYFYNIMSEYIKDKLLLELTYKFIYDNNESVGIPIGNYTSQYFANIYLDKYIKKEQEDNIKQSLNSYNLVNKYLDKLNIKDIY